MHITRDASIALHEDPRLSIQLLIFETIFIGSFPSKMSEKHFPVIWILILTWVVKVKIPQCCKLYWHRVLLLGHHQWMFLEFKLWKVQYSGRECVIS